jgi:hypothetical protein
MNTKSKYAFPAAVGAMALFLSLAGCQNTAEEPNPEQPTTRPAMMSNVPSEGVLITPEMQRFDPGIGDTGTRTGGGGNDGR